MNRSSSLMQAAMVLNSLPKKQAALVLSRLEPCDIKAALDAVKRLDDISADELSKALDRLAAETERWQIDASDETEEVTAAQRNLEEALSTPRTQLEKSAETESPFKFLIDVIPMLRLHLLQDEHPKNVAIVLSMLPPDTASETMKGLDPALRVSVLKRVCEIDELHSEDVAQLSFALKLRLKKLLNSRQAKSIGVDLAARMLSCSDAETQEALLAHVGQSDPDLAVKLQRSVFKIERLASLSDSEIQLVLKSVDTACWAPALKNSSSELKSRIFACMAPRPADLLGYEIEHIGFVEGAVEELARQNVIQVVLRLARDGRIELRKKGSREPKPIRIPDLSYDTFASATSPIS